METSKYIHFISFMLLIFFGSMTVQAQESVPIKGRIIASTSNVDKIHIINFTSEKGTVTNEYGEFLILAEEHDSIYVSSVQFENRFVIVTKEMIASKNLVIELRDKMNELAEVLIDDIKLSGYLANDLNLIATDEVEIKNSLQSNLNEFIKKDKELNPYYQQNITPGIRIDKIAAVIIDKISKTEDRPKVYTAKELANKSIQLVNYRFFEENLKLEDNEICNFLRFCARDAGFSRLVLNNNAFVLIEYFESRIDDFREHRGANLNTFKEIPG